MRVREHGLISNAVKYNHSGAQRIRSYSTGAAPATFYVAENGIPTEQRDTVFRIFRRLHAADAYGGGSSGMGLAIAMKIVERHGGRMWIEDTPGGGTAVAFTLGPHDIYSINVW